MVGTDGRSCAVMWFTFMLLGRGRHAQVWVTDRSSLSRDKEVRDGLCGSTLPTAGANRLDRRSAEGGGAKPQAGPPEIESNGVAVRVRRPVAYSGPHRGDSAGAGIAGAKSQQAEARLVRATKAG